MAVSIWEGNKAQALIDAITQRFGIVGLSESAKQALLNCIEHMAWTDEDGQTYYNALEDALNEQTGIVRISANFNQGTAVFYPSTPINDLKAYLTVTAYYNNGSSKQITDYALSGTLTTGTSTITVSKGQKTDTFDVIVSASPYIYDWSATSGENPPDMTANSFDFNTEPGALYVASPVLRKTIPSGDFEITMVAKYQSLPGANNPKITINAYTSDNDNFNVMCNPNAYTTGDANQDKIAFYTNWSNKEATTYNQTVYREYKFVFENGELKVYFDGTLVKTFTKIDDTKHVSENGFNIVSVTDSNFYMHIKSIKIRSL